MFIKIFSLRFEKEMLVNPRYISSIIKNSDDKTCTITFSIESGYTNKFMAVSDKYEELLNKIEHR